MPANLPAIDLNPTAEILLRTAERLYALEGADNVSTRQISREAGQKNHSALQYHFGSREQLIEAILNYRMLPLDAKRQHMVDDLERKGETDNVRSLVEAFVIPFTSELLKPAEDSYYISLLMQLYSGYRGDKVFGGDNQRSQAIWKVSDYIVKALAPLPENVVVQRLTFMGTQMIYTVANWDHQRREGLLMLDADRLADYSTQLVDFVVGGLIAPVSTTAISWPTADK